MAELRERARTAMTGVGMWGCSVACHLKKGGRDVVLFER